QDVLNISVEDNGMGMSPDELKNIGQAYTQSKSAQMIDARGSGLGLSLVKKLVSLHKGRTVITSHPGAGTSVNIYIPVRKPV
ncbi:MAG: HAMP domain-containing histidine kinase, partial [Robiginitomaculum sp.]|nr:HAMP domain-containing histidine kinase [Robiginitomaculum sp.]